MNAAVRLAGYGGALALVFGAAWTVGAGTGPTPDTSAVATSIPADDHGVGHAHSGGGDDAHPAGLSATAAGYTLVPQVSTLEPGAPGEFAFTVTGSDGRPVTAFDVQHEKSMHLIVVRRDGAGFQHVHPALGADGSWRVPLALPAAGVYRAFADFVPTGGPELVLGTDLFAPGDFAPVDHPPTRVAQVDGYEVRLDGELVPGAASRVVATVSRDGQPVPDLEPYLGAFGHLVALRAGDLTYLHVHPDEPVPVAGARSGPAVPFTAEVPTGGSYRLFLDFRHGDVVRTAEFTVGTGP